ncbi:hypothetical protein KOR42_17490 [Thalassoglobus neptunius]|uniref:DUF368 domain-containing protein n=1 Tax=Thalassoglobus neptunius TaxID=1938619 RepID=A0A5C5X899_9PLAN|nr:DUF368 domain-containing protein [Thalassoglobus neptunius]TWT58375.1 hypothetical protein KOR42_17490 [Thalassoglobus neptunius]
MTDQPDHNRREPIPSQADFANLGRGLLMGGADIIPGVSGGTVALILGIYERLVTAISHVDAKLVSLVAQRKIRDAADRIDLRLLIPLGIGILSGVIALGSVMHTLLEDHRQLTFAAFFGMISASCYLVFRLIGKPTGGNLALLAGGVVIAYGIVTLPGLKTPPDALWYVFLCGAVAICAMILPGISGAFILLVLGKYHEITGIIKEVLKLKLSVSSVMTVIVFASGCLIGLISFSKLLRWLLAHKTPQTMSVLCGFMIGSLYKIWPFQIDTTPEIREFKYKHFEPVPLTDVPLNGQLLLTIAVAVVSAIAVLMLERLGTKKETIQPESLPSDENS